MHKAVTFHSELLEGHKGTALEVPFDPSARWGTKASPLWPGRRGFLASGTIGGHRFESVIVPRSRRFWLLVEDGLREKAGLAVGDRVKVVLRPAARVTR